MNGMLEWHARGGTLLSEVYVYMNGTNVSMHTWGMTNPRSKWYGSKLSTIFQLRISNTLLCLF